MVNNKEYLKYTIKWLMQDKGKVAFKEVDSTYTLSEKVIKSDPAKWGVKPGVKVDVNIVENEVIYLRKSEGQDVPKEEKKETHVSPEKQEPKLESDDVKTQEVVTAVPDVFTLTIHAMSGTKEVIAFKERVNEKGKNIWYCIPDDIKANLETLGIKGRVQVKVTFGELEVKGNLKPSILTIEVVPEEVKTETKENPTVESSPTGSSDKAYDQYTYKNTTGTSIEHQVALKGAVDIVIALIEKGLVGENAGDKVSELTAKFIKDIAG